MLNTRTLHNSAEFLTPSSVKQSIVCVQELLPIKYYSCDQVSRNEIGVECGMEVHTGIWLGNKRARDTGVDGGII